MAREIRAFAATIPAGTPIAAPIKFDMSFPVRAVDGLEIIIPSGPNGFVGFAVTNSGQPVIPYNAGAFIVGNNEKIAWPLSDQITSGSWGLLGYNTGRYAHTIYVRFMLDLVVAAAPGLILPSVADISALAGGGAETVTTEQAALAAASSGPAPTTGVLIFTNPPPSRAAPLPPLAPRGFG